MAKSNSTSYYEIRNVPNFDDFLIIYNHIIDGMYLLERVFKKNHKIRKFDISEMWQFSFENGIAVFDSTKKARLLSYFLEIDLKTIFKYAEYHWQNKLKPLEYLCRVDFWSTSKKEFSLCLNEFGKWNWLEYGIKCYGRNPFDLD